MMPEILGPAATREEDGHTRTELAVAIAAGALTDYLNSCREIAGESRVPREVEIGGAL